MGMQLLVKLSMAALNPWLWIENVVPKFFKKTKKQVEGKHGVREEGFILFRILGFRSDFDSNSWRVSLSEFGFKYSLKSQF